MVPYFVFSGICVCDREIKYIIVEVLTQVFDRLKPC